MKLNDYVIFLAPVIQYKNGQPFSTTKRVRASIIGTTSTGELKLRMVEGGYATKRIDELVE